MKIVSMSGWVKPQDAKPIFEKIVSLSDKKNPHVVYLATGGRDREINTPKDVKDLFLAQNCTVEEKSVCVTRMDEETIRAMIDRADILYAGGGDLRFLMRNWEKSGAMKYVMEAGKRGVVLCGSSTGAMCWTTIGFDDYGKKKQFRAKKGFPFFEICGGFEFIRGIGLMPFGMCPHYESPFWNRFRLYADKAPIDIPFLAMENNTAIAFDGEKYEIVRGCPAGKVFLYHKERGIVAREIDSLIGILE